jgi:uncharacterized protein (DUF4415 family)
MMPAERDMKRNSAKVDKPSNASVAKRTKVAAKRAAAPRKTATIKRQAELRKRRIAPKSAKTGTVRVSLEALKTRADAGITLTRADAPKYAVDESFWGGAVLVVPSANKTSVHLRVDADVLDWFRQQGKGHLTHMNLVLRSYMEASVRPPKRA